MNETLRQYVRDRAEMRCEYCRLPQAVHELPHQIEHIIAIKHKGDDAPENLALACYNCNSFKGPNIAGLDPATKQLTRLYHPRTDLWDEHFAWVGPELIEITAIGRTTIEVLRCNDDENIELRRILLKLDIVL